VAAPSNRATDDSCATGRIISLRPFTPLINGKEDCPDTGTAALFSSRGPGLVLPLDEPAVTKTIAVITMNIFIRRIVTSS
jgi:hypothetical protein